MNKKIKSLLLIWGAITLIVIIIAVIFNLSSTPENAIVEEDSFTDIELSLLTEEERNTIETSTTHFLSEFFTQNSTESTADRTNRISPLITKTSQIPNISLLVGNTWSSKFNLIKQTTATTKDVVWSDVSSTSAITYATVTITYTDETNFSDGTIQNWFVFFQKQDNTWLVSNIEEWSTAPVYVP